MIRENRVPAFNPGRSLAKRRTSSGKNGRKKCHMSVFQFDGGDNDG